MTDQKQNQNAEDPYATYEIPKSDSSYLKLEEGTTKIRLATTFKEVALHSIEEKGKYSTEVCKGADCGLCKVNNKRKIKYAYLCINRDDGKVYIYECPVTVFKQLLSFARNPEYGNPINYDITISREGKEVNTTYTVMPSPKIVPLTDEEKELVANSGLNLDEAYAVS